MCGSTTGLSATNAWFALSMMSVYGVRRPQLPRPKHPGFLGDVQSFPLPHHSIGAAGDAPAVRQVGRALRAQGKPQVHRKLRDILRILRIDGLPSEKLQIGYPRRPCRVSAHGELLTKRPDLCWIKVTAMGTRLLSMLRLLSADCAYEKNICCLGAKWLSSHEAEI
jgi:transposase InsO family protein